MRIKSRVLAAASSLAVAGGMMASLAPSAHGTPQVIGNCNGQVSLIKLTPPLGDQTQIGVKAVGQLAKDLTTKAPKGGQCSLIARTGDPHIPQPSGALHPISAAVSLLGNASCASGATAQAADAAAPFAWPLNGKITYTMSETYTDPITLAVKKYSMQADIVTMGFDPGGVDTIDLGGIVLTGLSPGANVSGSIWEDPVNKTGGPTGYNTGYEADAAAINNAIGCADGTPNNASIPQVLSGGGGASANSLLGSNNSTGPILSLGQ